MSEKDQNKNEKQFYCSTEKYCFTQCVNWSRAVNAGIITTVAMTIVMFLLCMNSLYLLGELALGNAASLFAIYLSDAIIHFGFGIIYAIIFALIFALIPCMNAAVKGIIYGTLLKIIAKVQNIKQFNNPCMVMVVEEEEVITITENVCQPSNPCNPCNPCNAATSSKFMAILISWINHVSYGLVLALVYCRKKAMKEEF